MSQKLPFLLIACLMSISARAQPCVSSNTHHHPLLLQETWVPSADTSAPNFTPIKTIRLHFEILQDDAGGGNFQNTPVDRAFLHDVVDEMNEAFALVTEPSDPIQTLCGGCTAGLCDATYIADSRIRFELQSIRFVQDSVAAFHGSPWNLNGLGVDKDSKLNVYWSQVLPTPAVGAYANTPEFGPGTVPLRVFLTNAYIDYQGISSYQDRLWQVHTKMKRLAHELGHTMDLLHTYPTPALPHQEEATSGHDYLVDVFGPTFNGLHEPPPGVNGWVCQTSPGNTCNNVGATCTNNLMGGVDGRPVYISPLQMGRMHRALALYSVRKYVKECEPRGRLRVTAGLAGTWDFDIKLYRNLHVEPGVQLTSTCAIRVPADSEVTVSAGANLTLDAGTLTTDCEGMWTGALVDGQSQAPQSIVLGGNSGVLILKNGAMLEKALTGVHVFGGGVVRARSGSVFRNNGVDVRFEAYQHPSNPNVGNFSGFHETTFEVTEALGYPYVKPETRVLLEGMNRVAFLGCTFRNVAPLATHPVQDRGVGITGIDTRFAVGPKCHDLHHCSQRTRSRFEGLQYGIDAAATDLLKPVHVTYTDFQDNWRGVRLRGVGMGRIWKCTFDVAAPDPSPQAHPSPDSRGVHLDECTGYRIEDNVFSSSDGGTKGIFLENSGTDANVLYRNDFSHLEEATVTGGVNGGPFGGLRFKCNDYDQISSHDILVSWGSVAQDQGGCAPSGAGSATPAANRFSHPCTNTEDFWLHGSSPNVNYRHTSDADSTPACASAQLNATNCGFTYSAALCPSRVPSPGLVGGISTIPQVHALTSMQSQLLVDAVQLLSPIDASRRPELLQLLSEPGGDDSRDIESLLQQSYPLSEPVLSASINATDALSDEALTELLVANSPLPWRVLRDLESRVPPLPARSVDWIHAVQTGVSDRELIEAPAAPLLYQRNQITLAVLSLYLDDTELEDPHGELLQYLETESLVDPYYRSEDLSDALVDMLTARGELSRARDALDHVAASRDDVATVQGIVLDLLEAGIELEDLATAPDALESLQAMVADPRQRGSARAEALLELAGVLD